jgi:ABC-type phosphate transport system substrate-binding protein
LLAAPAWSVEVVIIAHPSVSVDQITSAEVRDFYTGDIKEWRNGDAVVVMALKPRSDAKKAFYKYLGMSSSRMKSIWMKNMLSGDGQPPRAHETEEEVLKNVASTPGAIGYVRRSLVTAEVTTLAVIPVETE